jgi:membrane fusion protein, macrolide-specific efflux system
MQTDIILSMSDRLLVKANVDETDLALIKLNQPATIILDAFPANPLDSKVVHIGYDAKTVNNVTTYEVDVVAEHTPDFMKSGMTANVTFLIDEKDDALVVSATAIKKEHHKTLVLMPNPDKGGEPIEREVKVGITDGKKVEILSGLSEGEDVLSASLRSLAQRSEDRQNNSNSFSPLGGSSPGGGRPPR